MIRTAKTVELNKQRSWWHCTSTGSWEYSEVGQGRSPAYNLKMALGLTWEERIQDVRGPVPFNPLDYTSNVPLGDNSPTNVQARIYDTPGNTPLNRSLGRLYEMPGRYGGEQWKDNWFKGSQSNY